MRYVGEKVIQVFGSFGKLLDLVLGLAQYLHPLVDDDLGELSDEEDHDEVKDGPRDKESIEHGSCEDHVDQLVSHCHVESELAERDE